jgi:O-antigen/teichoic acid export membrane protein
MTLLRAAARGISIVAASQLVMWVAALAFTIAQARYLGPARFGELSVALSYAAFLAIVVDFGLGTQLSRMVAQRAAGQGEALVATLLIRCGLWLAALPFLVIATLAFGYDRELSDAVYLLSVYILFVGLSTTFASYLQGHEQFLLAAVAQVAQRVTALGIGMLMLIVQPELTAVAGAFVAGGLVNVVVLLAGLRRRPWLPARVDVRGALGLLRSAVPLGLYWIATTFYWSVGLIILERLAPAENVGWYAAAYRLFSVATIPPSVIAGIVLYPVLARLALGARGELRAVIEKALTLLTLSGIAAAMVFAVLAEPIVALLYPAEAYAEAASALRLLAPGLLFIYVNWIFASSLLSLHKERRLLVIAFAAAVLNPLANFVLVPLFAQDGAALTTTLTELLILVWLVRTMPRDLLSAESVRVAAKGLLAAAATALLLIPVRDASLFLTAPLALAVFGMLTLALQAVSTSDLRALRALVRPMRAEDVRP